MHDFDQRLAMSGTADAVLREVADALRRGPARVTLRGVVPQARPFLAAALHRALPAPLLVVTPDIAPTAIST